LVHELQNPIIGQGGFFISGKFDQVASDAPYETIVQAFRKLIRQMLTQSEERIVFWKERLQDALGENASLIVELIPEVELILGEKPAPVPELPLTQEQSRLHRTFQRFICVFANEERPLCLFLDDLQWADPASLSLLRHLITTSDTKYF